MFLCKGSYEIAASKKLCGPVLAIMEFCGQIFRYNDTKTLYMTVVLLQDIPTVYSCASFNLAYDTNGFFSINVFFYNSILYFRCTYFIFVVDI